MIVFPPDFTQSITVALGASTSGRQRQLQVSGESQGDEHSSRDAEECWVGMGRVRGNRGF